jgi:hypothetical protein
VIEFIKGLYTGYPVLDTLMTFLLLIVACLVLMLLGVFFAGVFG